MDWTWVVGAFALVVILGMYVGATYNRFITLRNRVHNAWSQVQVQLKRRWDLIPNLVNTVKGYAAHESETFEAVVAARNAAAGATNIDEAAQAENALTGALRQLFAVAEAYPDLKANENFLSLQTELTGTEDKITYSRQFYNDSVLSYNNSVQTFPGNIFAGMFNFVEMSFFEIDQAETAVPSVSFE